MAHVTTNDELSNSSLVFHPSTFGQNIRLEENGSRAIRYTSFDHGVTFTQKPVSINERIHLRIVDVDETRQWCGSLAIGRTRRKEELVLRHVSFFIAGFTQVDPSSIRQEDLPKSALPNLGLNMKNSYVKRLYETLTKHLCIIFYYNPE